MPIRIVNRHTDSLKVHSVARMTPGQRIRRARKLRGMTQPELAKAAGIKQSSVSEIETGETKVISGDTLIQICAALRIRANWVMTGKGDMETRDSDLGLTAEEIALIYRVRENPKNVYILPDGAPSEVRQAFQSLTKIKFPKAENVVKIPQPGNGHKKRSSER